MNNDKRVRGAPDARTLQAEPVQIPVLLEFGVGADRHLLSELPALLASAPHRLMFLGGTLAVMLSMAWWTAVLAAGFAGWSMPPAPVPPGWAHAMLTQYGMFPLFMFGFLLTVFPRWLGQPALQRRHYVPVFLGLFGGYLLAHIGLLDRPLLLKAGLLLMLGGWLVGLVTLARVNLRSRHFDQHALSCLVALGFGACGLVAFTAFLFGASPQWALHAIKVGTFGLLLPIYFTVCHRMIPFFSGNVVGPGYRLFRPRWSLALLWLFALAHLAMTRLQADAWLWLADAPLAILFLVHVIGWQPWKCMRPGLLAVLHLSSLWLPFAFILFAVQSALLVFGSDLSLGRAPVHALTIGFFGSMLVAMVTRVSQGHSGRPLEMGRVAWLTFVLVQGVAVLRLAAEAAADTGAWLVVTGAAWLVAFLPWVLRSAWIVSTPRIDGKPG